MTKPKTCMLAVMLGPFFLQAQKDKVDLFWQNNKSPKPLCNLFWEK
uniref:Uncharacterized protein n=1 Tax=Arundo donax TaxID=35708 RepID=A0A0A9FZ08_ARUDO